jgi:AraC family transcriptional regulator of adaptative response / DNA-3-methyladenine glycosylase II
VQLDPDLCYRALAARDRRFDGLFFVGVRTTGIYCRSVCTARTPRRDRCTFHRTAAEAERAGFRACFRCRPELAPGGAPLDAVPRLVSAAVLRIDAGFLDTRSVEELAEVLGVTSRHLRRAMEAELGTGPLELAAARRLARAKQLLTDTTLPTTQVAYASGFRSLRRFHAAFRERFGAPPSSLRSARTSGERDVVLRLGYRPPFDWEALLAFLEARAMPGVEAVQDGAYERVLAADEGTGVLRVTHEASSRSVWVRVPLPLAARSPWIASRARALFDLDAHPEVVSSALAHDPLLAPLVARRPGLRVPGTFEPFEGVVRAVLGQQVSVRGARTLGGRLVAALGMRCGDGPLSHAFPTAARIARASEREIASIGMPLARARALIGIARAIDEGELDLEPGPRSVEETIEALIALPGIGPWTAQYIALRALRWPDAFPAGDLGVRNALGVSAREAEQRAAVWRPWRAYAVLHLWCGAEGGANALDDDRDRAGSPARRGGGRRADRALLRGASERAAAPRRAR